MLSRLNLLATEGGWVNSTVHLLRGTPFSPAQLLHTVLYGAMAIHKVEYTVKKSSTVATYTWHELHKHMMHEFGSCACGHSET